MTRTEFLQSLLIGAGIGISPTVSQAARNHLPEEESDDGPLDLWNRRPLFPVQESENPKVNVLLQAAQKQSRVEFPYYGGSEPMQARAVSPILVFMRPRPRDLTAWLKERFPPVVYEEHQDKLRDIDPFYPFDREKEDLVHLSQFLQGRCPIYLLAWCHRREAQRCFRLDRMGNGEILFRS